jgi:hypothetical protein
MLAACISSGGVGSGGLRRGGVRGEGIGGGVRGGGVGGSDGVEDGGVGGGEGGGPPNGGMGGAGGWGEEVRVVLVGGITYRVNSAHPQLPVPHLRQLQADSTRRTPLLMLRLMPPRHSARQMGWCGKLRAQYCAAGQTHVVSRSYGAGDVIAHRYRRCILPRASK